MGAFSLSIADNTARSRTVMPTVVQEDITWLRLIFTNVVTNEEEVRNLAQNNLSGIVLPVGVYTLRVLGYLDQSDMDGGNAIGAADRPIAEGIYPGQITIQHGIPANANVTLAPFGVQRDGARGTFSWDITGIEHLSVARMEVTAFSAELAGTTPSPGVWYFTGGSPEKHYNDSVDLDVGFYIVTLTVERTNTRPVILRHALHIHENLTSNFVEEFSITDFLSDVFTVTFDYNHIAAPGVSELSDLYFFDHFVGVTQANYDPGDDVMDIMDATREGRGYDFMGWFAQSAVSPWDFGQLSADITLYARWEPRYRISFTTSGEGQGTASTTATSSLARAGATVTITAVPAPRNRLVTWSSVSTGVSLASATVMTTTFVMPPNDVTIDAEFFGIPENTPYLELRPQLVDFGNAYVDDRLTAEWPDAITVEIENVGHVTATVQSINISGTSFVLTNAGAITSIASDEIVTFTVRPTTVNVLPVGPHNADITVTYYGGAILQSDPDSAVAPVTFTVDAVPQFGVTVNIEGYGGVTVNGAPVASSAINVPRRMPVTIVATPNTTEFPSTFVRWEEVSDGVVFADPSLATTTFTMPDGPVTIRAVFIREVGQVDGGITINLDNLPSGVLIPPSFHAGNIYLSQPNTPFVLEVQGADSVEWWFRANPTGAPTGTGATFTLYGRDFFDTDVPFEQTVIVRAVRAGRIYGTTIVFNVAP